MTTMPHRYNVADFFYVTKIWSELNGPHVVFMFRLQKVNLAKKSWWAPQHSPMPSAMRDYDTKATSASCLVCHQPSPQIYNEGWICTSYDGCPEMGKLNGQDPPAQLTFNQDFLNERTQWPAAAMLPSELIPSAPVVDSLDPHFTTSLTAWKGFVCPECQCCNSRIDWSWEKCQADGCTYSHKISHPVVSHLSLLPLHALEIDGHAVSLNEYRGHVGHPEITSLGHWKLMTYKLCNDNYVTHFLANKHINGRPGGANDIFRELQRDEGIDLQRPYMKNSPGESTTPCLRAS